MTKKDADEHFVVILSDANLDIYGIHPSMLGTILASDDRCVCVYVCLCAMDVQHQIFPVLD